MFTDSDAIHNVGVTNNDNSKEIGIFLSKLSHRVLCKSAWRGIEFLRFVFSKFWLLSILFFNFLQLGLTKMKSIRGGCGTIWKENDLKTLEYMQRKKRILEVPWGKFCSLVLLFFFSLSLSTLLAKIPLLPGGRRCNQHKNQGAYSQKLFKKKK